MRTVIYARFSSDNQNPRSAEDQIAVCRERADREGWPVIAVFQDVATSGAAGIGADQRPGLSSMLRLVEGGGIDQVLAESTDRVSRHVADAHIIRERLEFAGARLFTLFDGTVTPIIGLIKGFTDSQFRTDLAARSRRGHIANINRGRASSGVAYGYRIANRLDERGQLDAGLREIDAERAEVVRRIFREYAAGISPRAIAMTLNAEGMRPPRGGAIWQTSTILGHNKTGFGILRNRVYLGKLVYGRSKSAMNPVTRRKLMRPNPDRTAIVEHDVPDLRIVDDALWQRVHDRIEANRGVPVDRQRRPKHLLSGLGECGVCGGPWIKISSLNWGCSRHRLGNACSNNRNIATRQYERRVLADLKANMLAPDVVAAYVREYHRDFARQSAALTRDRARIERQLCEAERKSKRMLEAFADGGSEFAEIRVMLAAAKADTERLTRELSSIDAIPTVLSFHPRLEEEYRRQVEALEAALAEPHAAIEAVPRARSMISRIIVTPAAKRGVELEVARQVDQVLALTMQSPKGSGSLAR